MPEGPEIKRAADQIAAALVGGKLARVHLNHQAFAGYEHAFEDASVTAVTARSKAILTAFSTGITMYSHNQLYGVWQVSRPGEQPETRRQRRISLFTDRHEVVLYSATDISIWSSNEVHQHPYLQKLGPDVLAEQTSAAMLAERLQSKPFRNRSLAALYLDQGFLAGIGNYLRSEILFKAGCHPDDRPAQLSSATLRRLARDSITISRRSYKTGGVTNTAGRAQQLKRQGAGYEHYRFFVFNREAQPCYQCGKDILREDRGARRVYWCPACQVRVAN